MRSELKWVAVGTALVLTGVLGLLLAGSGRVFSAVRIVINPPEKSRPQGFTRDGRSYLTLSPEGTVFWDVATGQPHRPWSLRSFQVSAISTDGRTSLGVHGTSYRDATVGLVDVATGEFRAKFPTPFPNVLHLSFMDQDRSIRAFIADRDFVLREVITWNLASHQEVRRVIAGPSQPGFLSRRPAGFSPDGQLLVYVNIIENGVQIWDVEQDQAVGGLLKTPTSKFLIGRTWVAFSPNGQRLVVGRLDGAVEVWDLAARRCLRIIPIHPSNYTFDEMTIAPDGRTLASTALFGGTPGWVDLARSLLESQIVGRSDPRRGDEVILVDLDSGQRLARWPQTNHPWFSPDGRTVVTHESDGTFSIRDAPHPTPLVSDSGPGERPVRPVSVPVGRRSR